MPYVRKFGAGFREKQCPHRWGHCHMSAEPGCMMAAAGETPGPGQPVTARDRAGLSRAGRTPGDYAPPAPEDLRRHLRVEQGRRHRAAVRLAEAPGAAGVVLRYLLDDLHIGG